MSNLWENFTFWSWLATWLYDIPVCFKRLGIYFSLFNLYDSSTNHFFASSSFSFYNLSFTFLISSLLKINEWVPLLFSFFKVCVSLDSGLLNSECQTIVTATSKGSESSILCLKFYALSRVTAFCSLQSSNTF